MLGRANRCPARSPQREPLHLYVRDVDAAFERAVSAGARVRMPVADQFWGDRWGALVDPFGHEWGIGTHKEDLSNAEIERRGREFMEKMARQGN
jgi:hypothetical protein